MLDRIDTWIVLAVLFGLLACCLAASFSRIRSLEQKNRDLRSELSRQCFLACTFREERDIALARSRTYRSFWELRKDERIEDLEAENRALREAIQEV